jgi:hypothetical protein
MIFNFRASRIFESNFLGNNWVRQGQYDLGGWELNKNMVKIDKERNVEIYVWIRGFLVRL